MALHHGGEALGGALHVLQRHRAVLAVDQELNAPAPALHLRDAHHRAHGEQVVLLHLVTVFLLGHGQHPAVARVHHPGLESHPDHARARELFAHFGAMVSFEAKGGAAAAERMFSRLTLPLHAPSLGGAETLVTRPAASSHAGLSAEERAQIGISDGLVRVSIGLEAKEDLIEDFDRALRD